MSLNFSQKTRIEFLTDGAEYFLDKKNIYLDIKDEISSELGVPLSMIKICGSAYWGRSFIKDEPFEPSISDLDVALIDAGLFVKCLSEVREETRNYSNLTRFLGNPTNPIMFQDYAVKKGIIRIDIMPVTRSKKILEHTSDAISKKYVNHFSKISFMIYDSEKSFTVKQIGAFSKFRNNTQ